MKIFYTSDPHFSHANIILYSNRPFLKADGTPDIWAMNRHMTQAWNSVVKDNDTVILLGDFAMGQWKEWAGIRAKLNGRIVLIRGNHDRKLDQWMAPGDFAMNSLLFRDGTFLTHIPPGSVYEDRNRHDGLKPNPVPAEATRILCGHVHDAWVTKTISVDSREIVCHNVGVDVRGYVPLTLEQIVGS
jgi:calcineurin-like phosphoesterase family protein